MEITVAIIIMAVTLVAGEITKVTNIPNKYIPLQNIVIAIMASIRNNNNMYIWNNVCWRISRFSKNKKVLNLLKQVYKK